MSNPAVRRFTVACAIGGGVALTVFVAVLASAPGGFLDPTPFGMGRFYDEQARALFHGNWDAEADSFFIERLAVDGRYYMYFGPWPSVLRMPVLLVTSSLDGRLTRVSLALAFVVLLLATCRLLWQVRSLSRTTAPTHRELWCIAGFLVTVGCGTALVFLGASAWVYDEALLWGTAWAVWSMTFSLGYLQRSSRSLLVLAGVTTGLAIMSRVSCGVVGVVVLGSCFVVQLLASRRQPRLRAAGSALARLGGVDDRLAGRSPWPAGLAAAGPLAAYMVVNWLKFGSLFRVPFDRQDLVNAAIPERLPVLERNGPDLTSVQEVPTNLVNYFRPNGIALEPLFPFVNFSRDVELIGDPVRDIEQAYASITPSSTLLLVLALVGLAAVFVPRVGRAARLDDPRILRYLAIGAALASIPALAFPSLAHRYTVDFLPALLLLGAVGMYALAGLMRNRAVLRRSAAAAAAALLLVNVTTQLALTFHAQRGFQRVSTEQRSQYVLDRIDWTRRLGREPGVDLVTQEPGEELPVAPIGTFLVVGDCDRLLLSGGEWWLDLAFEDPAAVCEDLGWSPRA